MNLEYENEMPVRWEKTGEVSCDEEFKFNDITLPAGEYLIVDEKYFDEKGEYYYTMFRYLKDKNADPNENALILLPKLEERKGQ